MNTPRIPKTLLALCVAAGVSFAPAAAGAAGDAHPPQAIRDLRYGAALFDFYQGRYLAAITELMVAERRAPITRQGDEPQLLLGALYLSYGLERGAAEIFQQLLRREAAPDTHDLAWFYLGKLRYDAGRLREALTAFAAVGDALPKIKNDERLQLMVNAYSREQDFAQAAATLAQLQDGGIWRAYAQYNLGIALLRARRGAEGMALLGRVGLPPARDEEEYALRDKANMAMGYAALRDPSLGDPAAAFAQVRLNGPYSNQALLGMGWARSAQGLPQEALAPWFELNTRAADLAAQEAWVAVAYTLEKLGAGELALNYYQHAIAAYDQERGKIDAALAVTNCAALLQSDLAADRAALAFPAREYLDEVLASAEFQAAYRDYRDLRDLRALVAAWREKIPLLQTMLGQRRLHYASNAGQLGASDYARRLAVLDERRAALAAKIAAIAGEEKPEALAGGKERETLIQLQAIAARLENLARQGVDVKAQRDKWRIMSGLLGFRLKSEFPERLWKVQRQQRGLDAALAQAAQARSALDAVLQITPLNFEQLAAHIAAQDASLAGLAQRLDAALAKQGRYCTGLMGDSLAASKRRIETYRDRARYAEARLYDQLSHRPQLP